MRDTLLTDEQLKRLWLLVTRAYRRMYHDYRPLDEWTVLDWTLDTYEGRDTFTWAARVITGMERENKYE